MTKFSLKTPDIREKECCVVELHGELDQMSVPVAEERVSELLGTFSGRYFIFDLGGLHFINSEGIGFLVETQMKLSKKKGELLLCRVKRNVAEVFALIGLPKIIRVFDHISDALRYVTKKAS